MATFRNGRWYDSYQGDFNDRTDSGADSLYITGDEHKQSMAGYKSAWEEGNKEFLAAQAAGNSEGMEVARKKMDDAHMGAESLRELYGYLGGTNGGAYNVLAKLAVDGNTGSTGGVGSVNGGSSFTYASAPDYASKYQGQIDELTKEILGRAAFEYDPFKDPTYQQYEQSYRENGRRAMQDTLGQVSARSGGLASSYADRASQQAYDGYMSELADKIPDLKQLAYQMYMDDLNGKRADLSLLTGLDDRDYQKFLTELGQYNTDRQFAYGVNRDNVLDNQWTQEFLRKNFESDRDFTYGVSRDNVSDDRYNQEWEYKQSQDVLSRGDTERQNALDRISTYLASGGKAENLDDALVATSGLTDVELASLEAEFARQRSMEDERFAMDKAESNAAIQAKTASTNKSSGGSSSSSSTKDKYQDKSSNYYRIKATAAEYGDAEDVQAYLDRMIEQGYITVEEGAEMFALDLGYDPSDLSGMDDVGVYSSGAPTTFDELRAAFPNKPRPHDERDFKEAKSRGESWAVQYKTYQDYLTGMYEKWSKER